MDVPARLSKQHPYIHVNPVIRSLYFNVQTANRAKCTNRTNHIGVEFRISHFWPSDAAETRTSTGFVHFVRFVRFVQYVHI